MSERYVKGFSGEVVATSAQKMRQFKGNRAVLRFGAKCPVPEHCGPAGPARGPFRGNGDSGDRGTGTGIVTKTRTKTKKPSLYKVLILNDDYTPMEFVVHVLERFFAKPREEAVQIMLHVHRHGVGICGVYTFEVAETKVAQVIELARRHQHPLQCTMENE